MEYAKTMDIPPPHRDTRIKNIFVCAADQGLRDGYIYRVVETVESVEVGFDHVYGIGCVKNFRKRRWGRWDLNPGPPAPQAGILAMLDDGPTLNLLR